MSWECVSYWIEHHPGLASWVQAAGALISIWAAWSIARSQSKKIEKADRQRDRAKYGAVIGILNHSKSVLQGYISMKDFRERQLKLKVDVVRLAAVLDGIDLLSLPSIQLVEAVCRVRQKFEEIDLFFKDPNKASMVGFHFEFMVGDQAISLIEEEVQKCELAMAGLPK
jgi:hypothetical protein